MALTPNLTRTAITDDGLESTWEDETVYGGANPDRNEVAVWLTAYKVNIDEEETAVDVATFDPEVATTFTTDNSTDGATGLDGWYRYYFVIIDNWLIGTTYNRYDLVWSTTENAFYEYTNATPSAGNLVTNGTYWTEVEDPTTKIANVGTASESGNLTYQVINKVLSYQTSICYIKAASKHAKENCGCDDDCNERLAKLFRKIRDLFNNLALNESTGMYKEGEKNVLLAQKYCDDCGCLTR